LAAAEPGSVAGRLQQFPVYRLEYLVRKEPVADRPG
jgi:hypothetical protein